MLSEIESKVAASAGAACHADEIDVSPTLQAMQVPIEYAMGTIRFSTGRNSTSEEIKKAAEIVTGKTEPFFLIKSHSLLHN